jgi:NADPH2:quinone reductase
MRMKEVRILVTGASGCVGNYLVQLAKLAGAHVTATSSSNERNKDFLYALGADDVIEYSEFTRSSKQYHVIVDTVGGSILKACWSLVGDNGSLITVDSASWDFVREQRKSAVTQGKGNVKALFFIVAPSRKNLEQLSAAFDEGLLQPSVACTLPLEDVRLAYDMASESTARRGKVVLVL